MKKIFTLLFFLMIGFSALIVAQKNNANPIPFPSTHSHNGIICGIGEAAPGLVIPAPIVENLSQNAAVFEVTYTDNVPTAARNSFERATAIMSSFINSSVPITVMVEASDDLAPGSLAGASPGTFLRDFPNAPVVNAWYPVALAEKLEQQNFSNAQAPFDINVTYNSETNWNFTSTNITGNQFDFVTVILHELMHGLGFSGLGNVNDNGLGNLLLQNFPAAYSTFLQNGNGDNLFQTFPSPSVVLGDQLTSNDVFMNTETLAAQNQISRIFSPSPFNPGSSISHLDQFTFTGTPHALMRPGIGPGSIIHNPGNIALDILYDLGWRKTSVRHQPGPISSDVNMPYVIFANVVSEIGFDASTLQVHYSRDTFATEMTAAMTPTGTTGEFTVTLPAPGERTSYQYYFSLNNSRQQQIITPTAAPGANFFEFFYDVDEILPEIVHESINWLDDKSSQFVIEASITDVFTGVDSAFIAYRINGGAEATTPMVRDFSDGFRPDLYVGVIPLPENGLNGGDLIQYQIIANDNSDVSNLITSPSEDATFDVNITTTLAVVNSYANTFEVDEGEFNGNGFAINTPSGFADGGINSIHPYTAAGRNNIRNFNYNLRTPIIIRGTDPLIEFDEVVLVEPGDPGTQFGETEFWDFVIVEGRRSNSAEWKPFLDGYDAGANPSWFNAYISNLAGLNSLTVGSENLFEERVIDMQASGDFVEGDTVLIRFRLFSDGIAVGWGWAIDNLRIQDSQVAVEDFINEQDFSIYPNPVGKEILSVEAKFKQTVNEVVLKLSTIHGQTVQRQNFSVNNQILTATMDAQNLPKGVYLLTMTLDGKEQITRRIVKQ